MSRRRRTDEDDLEGYFTSLPLIAQVIVSSSSAAGWPILTTASGRAPAKKRRVKRAQKIEDLNVERSIRLEGGKEG